MGGLPEPDWYQEHVLAHAQPGVAALSSPGPAEEWQAWWGRQGTQPAPLGGVLRAQGFVLTPQQLGAAGVSRQRARTLVRHGSWSSPAYGVVSPIDVHDADPNLVRRRRHAVAAAAAALRRPGHVVSGASAAVLHGLPVFAIPTLPEVTDPWPNGLGRRGVSHVHGARISPLEIGTWFGVRVTVVARTLADLARHSRRDAIIAADAALRERLATRDQIDSALARAAGWPGVRQARDVLALADPRAESPLESLTRLALHDDGFPQPELQVWIGRVVHRWPQTSTWLRSRFDVPA